MPSSTSPTSHDTTVPLLLREKWVRLVSILARDFPSPLRLVQLVRTQWCPYFSKRSVHRNSTLPHPEEQYISVSIEVLKNQHISASIEVVNNMFQLGTGTRNHISSNTPFKMSIELVLQSVTTP